MHEKGFSLIELLTTLVLLALLLPLSGSAMSELLRSNRQQDAAQMLASGGDYIYRSVPRDDGRYFGVQVRKDF